MAKYPQGIIIYWLQFSPCVPFSKPSLGNPPWAPRCAFGLVPLLEVPQEVLKLELGHPENHGLPQDDVSVMAKGSRLWRVFFVKVMLILMVTDVNRW